MELARRGSLYSVLHGSSGDGDGKEEQIGGGAAARPKHTLSIQLRYRLALEAARGLLHLHEADLVHRDIKSANVLVTEDWHALLADFGLAKAKDETKTTTKVALPGTLRWTAPELFSLRPKFTTA